MKNTLILFAVVLVAGFVAWILIRTSPEASASYDTSMSEFAIEEIQQVARVFISDKSGNQVDLVRTRDGWTVNQVYPADQGSVDLLLKGMQKLEIQYIPPKAAEENILKTMAAFAIQVEAFNRQGSLLKKYYIGGMTQDERGTYFLMDGADQPYVMQVPGFVGNLRERFRPEIRRFRSQKFMHFDPGSVARIAMHYPQQQENNFVIESKITGYGIYTGEKMEEGRSSDASRGKVLAYLDRLQQIACEAYLTDDVRQDSVTAGIPFCTLDLEFDTGEKTKVRFWQKLDPGSAGQPVNRFFVLKDEEFMLAQYNVIKEAFRNGAFFTT